MLCCAVLHVSSAVLLVVCCLLHDIGVALDTLKIVAMAICLHSVDSFETGAQYLQPCSLCTSVTVDSFKTGAIPIWLKGVCVCVYRHAHCALV